MSMFKNFTIGYPPKDQLVEQTAFGMLAALAAAVIYYVLLRLDYLNVTFDVFMFMWFAIYAAMLTGIGIARYRFMLPFKSKKAFIIAMTLSAVGMALGIALLIVSGYYSRFGSEDLYGRSFALIIPLAGAVALGFDIEVPVKQSRVR